MSIFSKFLNLYKAINRNIVKQFLLFSIGVTSLIYAVVAYHFPTRDSDYREGDVYGIEIIDFGISELTENYTLNFERTMDIPCESYEVEMDERVEECFTHSKKYTDYIEKYGVREIEISETIKEASVNQRIVFFNVRYSFLSPIKKHISRTRKSDWITVSFFTGLNGEIVHTNNDSQLVYGPFLREEYLTYVSIEVPKNTNAWAQSDISCFPRDSFKMTGFYRLQYEKMAQGVNLYTAYLMDVSPSIAVETYKNAIIQTSCI